MDSFKSIDVFNINKLFELTKHKISCFEFLSEELLIIGTIKGVLLLYQIQDNNNYIEISQPINVSKYPISKLYPIKRTNQIFILAENVLILFLLSENKIIEIMKGVLDFSLNYSINEIKLSLVFNNKISVYSMQIDNIMNMKDNLKLIKDISINYIVNYILWIDKNIFISITGKDYGILDIAKGKINLLKIGNNDQPFIKKINDKEIFLITKVKQDFVGIFIDENGNMINKNTLNIYNIKKIISFYLDKNFIVVLTLNEILIFSNDNCELLQKIKIKDYKIMNSFSLNNSIVVSNKTEIFRFLKNPIEKIIDSCIEINDFKKGVSIVKCFNLNKKEEYKDLEPNIYLQCGFKSLSQQKYIEAEECFNKVNFDPIELIEMVFQEYNIKNLEINKNTIYNKTSLQTFKNILTNKKNYLINNYNTDDQVYFYNQDSHKLNKLIWLNYVDYALLKLFLDLNEYDELIDFYDTNTIHCEHDNEKIIELIENMNTNSDIDLDKKYIIIGILYNIILEYSSSLDYFKKAYQKTNNELVISNRSIKTIIKIQTNRNLFFNMINEHIDWMSNNNLKGLRNLFDKIKIDLVLPEEIFRKLFSNDNNNIIILESFLTSMIYHHKVKLESFHSELILLFLNISKNKNSEEYFSKFKNFLYSDFNNINKVNLIKILQTLKEKNNSDFIKSKRSDILLAEIFLNRKIGNHESIINKLIIEKEFALAEDYCSNELFSHISNTEISNNEKLLNILLKQYINLLENDIIEKKLVINLISKFLKKYAGHSQLDTSNVLQILPDDLLINETEINIVDFLKLSFNKKNYERKNIKSKRQISEVYYQNINYKLTKRKKAHIIVKENTKCMLSGNLIGDKVFDVYPNGSLILHNQNLNNNENICPITKQNFKIFNKNN